MMRLWEECSIRECSRRRRRPRLEAQNEPAERDLRGVLKLQLRAARDEAGDVDALVNAAGVGAMASFLDVETDAFDQCVAVNCRAPLVLSQCVARNMIARGVPGAVVRSANQPSERL